MHINVIVLKHYFFFILVCGIYNFILSNIFLLIIRNNCILHCVLTEWRWFTRHVLCSSIAYQSGNTDNKNIMVFRNKFYNYYWTPVPPRQINPLKSKEQTTYYITLGYIGDWMLDDTNSHRTRYWINQLR